VIDALGGRRVDGIILKRTENNSELMTADCARVDRMKAVAKMVELVRDGKAPTKSLTFRIVALRSAGGPWI
jgi:hypothetical protein